MSDHTVFENRAMGDQSSLSAGRSAGEVCTCGHSAFTRGLSVKKEYSIFGWVLLLIGVTAHPFRVTVRCPQCGHVFEPVTDPVLCAQFGQR